MGVFVKVVKRKGKCGHCNKRAKILFIVGGVTYAQECFKKLFTEKTDIDKLQREFDERVYWVLLTGPEIDSQEMRLVCHYLPKKEKWLGLVGYSTQRKTSMQKVYEKQGQARKYCLDRLEQFMKDHGYDKISIMSDSYSDVAS